MGNRPRKKVKKSLAAPRSAPPAEKPELVRRLLRSIVVLYLFFALAYAVQIPFGKAPDETAHLRYVTYLTQHHRLPVFQSTNPGADYEFHQPPLYYVLALPSYTLTRGAPAQKGQTVRFFSLLIGLALVYLTYALARRLVPDRPWTALAATAIVAFLPMHLHLAASVGNDVLTEVWFAAALLLLVGYLRVSAGYRAGGPAPAWRTALWVGLFIGLGMLTKSLASMLFPVAWAGFALSARGPESYQWRRLARDVGICTGVALLLCGWWLVRNQMLYGDPLAQGAFLRAFTDRPSPQAVMAAFQAKTGEPLSPTWYVLAMVVPWTVASALGVFGPKTTGNDFVFYPVWVYLAAAAVGLLALFGFVHYLRRERLASWQAGSWLIIALLAALVLASFVRFNLSYFQAQARYLFPALPPAALAACLGLEQYAPRRYGSWVSLTVAAALGLLALVGLAVWIAPQFISL